MAKPIVHCDLMFPASGTIAAGNQCMVVPKDHPNHHPDHRVTNGSVVWTSRVVAVDLLKNQFETLNTIYQFEEQENANKV